MMSESPHDQEYLYLTIPKPVPESPDDYVPPPVTFYGDDSGLIHVFIECAERLDCSYRNLGEYEPPNAQIDLTPENATLLRDSLTKALAAHRRDTRPGAG